MRPTNNISSRHELPVSQQIVDIRPFSAKYAEWISDKFNLMAVAIPVALMTAVMPVLGLLTLPFLLLSTFAYVSTKSVLPIRYPHDGKDEKGKPGTGILYKGEIDDKSVFEQFKEIWESDDDLRKHQLILGSTGSGKSEALKSIFFNALSWSSGFFIADGKADNKLPTDTYTMARSLGRDQDVLFLNFLLAGKTPEQVRRSRVRRTNKLNPFPAADADTIIQMGANMLPKVEGDAKNWQEKGLNLWRSAVAALCYKRDKTGMELSVSTFIDYMQLAKVEELYMEGFKEAQERGGEWSYGYVGIKAYLESGLPSYMVSKLLKKHGYGEDEAAAAGPGGARGFTQGGGGGKRGGKETEQDSMAYEQHSYRTNQLFPVLNLLDKTYGYIFRDRYSEIDMSDVTLRNRILVMLIPSLEKSAQEAENLGKLAIACLRVMMSKNLGAEIEGRHEDLLGAKATNSPYPYVVALDELAYYFSDGIAVMFAQARSLGTAMFAAAQDLEKLMEGSRAPEAGAMLANQTIKNFMRIDDAGKTAEMIQKITGKAMVAVKRNFRHGAFGFERTNDLDITEAERVSLQKLQSFGQGEGVINALGRTHFMKWFYMGKDIERHRVPKYRVNRFLQVATPTREEIIANSLAVSEVKDPYRKGQELVHKLTQRSPVDLRVSPDPMISALQAESMRIGPHVSAEERAIRLYMAARAQLLAEDEALKRQAEQADGLDEEAEEHAQSSRLSGEPNATPQSLGGAPAEEDDLLVGVLGNSTPFQRKPTEILGLDQPIGDLQAPPQSTYVMDPFEALVMTPGRGAALSRANRLQHEAGASKVLPMPGGPIVVGATDDWIALATGEAVEMIHSPRSSDDTVVGFTEETMSKIVVAEELLQSVDPPAGARHVERVVAARITPVTRPESLKDEYDVDAVLTMLEDKVVR